VVNDFDYTNSLLTAPPPSESDDDDDDDDDESDSDDDDTDARRVIADVEQNSDEESSGDEEGAFAPVPAKKAKTDKAHFARGTVPSLSFAACRHYKYFEGRSFGLPDGL
jgi:hypothetical protein